MKRKIESELLKWKNNKSKLPLLINGARQIGKTYSILEFGNKHYKNIVYVNFEEDRIIGEYFSGNLDPDNIIGILNEYYQVKIYEEETLIIFDEIQSCSRALTALKYFSEKAPKYHIISAGSLLGVAINRKDYSFPVGKVIIKEMYSLDFEEFLWASNKKIFSNAIREHFNRKEALPENIHKECISLYNEYLIIGGMPASILSYINGGVISDQEIRQNIINTYSADMSKYASNSDSVKIRSTFESIPAQLAKDNKKFQYKIIQKGARSSIFGFAIDWLTHSGIVIKAAKIKTGELPLAAYEDLSSFKLYMSDNGLLSTLSGITKQMILMNWIGVFKGALTENYVASSLKKNGYPLYYWESEGKAEVDFVIVKENSVIPIEVKSSRNNHSKSINVFMKRYNSKYGIRISLRNFGFENNIFSVPLYAAFLI